MLGVILGRHRHTATPHATPPLPLTRKLEKAPPWLAPSTLSTTISEDSPPPVSAAIGSVHSLLSVIAPIYPSPVLCQLASHLRQQPVRCCPPAQGAQVRSWERACVPWRLPAPLPLHAPLCPPTCAALLHAPCCRGAGGMQPPFKPASTHARVHACTRSLRCHCACAHNPPMQAPAHSTAAAAAATAALAAAAAATATGVCTHVRKRARTHARTHARMHTCTHSGERQASTAGIRQRPLPVHAGMVGGLQPPSEAGEEQERLCAGQGVIFVLEDAQLEVAQVGKVGGQGKGRGADRRGLCLCLRFHTQTRCSSKGSRLHSGHVRQPHPSLGRNTRFSVHTLRPTRC